MFVFVYCDAHHHPSIHLCLLLFFCNHFWPGALWHCMLFNSLVSCFFLSYTVFFIVYMIKYVSHVTVTHYPNVYCTTVHTDSKEILSHLTSDLRAACETDWHWGSRGVAGRMLSLSHSVGLMDPLTSAELAVLCGAWAEARRLIMTCLKEDDVHM